MKRIFDIYSLRDVFDRLLEITELWLAFYIDIMRRYLLLRYYKISWFCNIYIILLTRLKKLINYLYLIQKIWSEIAGDNLTIIRLIDRIIVKLLKLQVFENSDKDAQFVQKQIYQRSIFGVILNLLLRRQLLINLLALNRLILLLHTFSRTQNI